MVLAFLAVVLALFAVVLAFLVVILALFVVMLAFFVVVLALFVVVLVPMAVFTMVSVKLLNEGYTVGAVVEFGFDTEENLVPVPAQTRSAIS